MARWATLGSLPGGRRYIESGLVRRTSSLAKSGAEFFCFRFFGCLDLIQNNIVF